MVAGADKEDPADDQGLLWLLPPLPTVVVAEDGEAPAPLVVVMVWAVGLGSVILTLGAAKKCLVLALESPQSLVRSRTDRLFSERWPETTGTLETGRSLVPEDSGHSTRPLVRRSASGQDYSGTLRIVRNSTSAIGTSGSRSSPCISSRARWPWRFDSTMNPSLPATGHSSDPTARRAPGFSDPKEFLNLAFWSQKQFAICNARE